MKLVDIAFADEAFKAAVLATGKTEAEEVKEIVARKSGIKSAAGVEFLPNLERLDLTRNKLTELDLSHNTRLKVLFVGNNQLESLDVSALTELEEIHMFMNDVAELDLSHNPRLEILYANDNDLGDLNLSGNERLVEVMVSGNSLKNLSLPVQSALEKIQASNNLLTDALKASLQQAFNGRALTL